jgi:kynurenine formamidase
MIDMKVGCALLIVAALAMGRPEALGAQDPLPRVPVQQMDEWMTQVSNWGRWGPEDELGTLNLITDQKRQEAAGLVQEGFAVSLARDVDKETAPDNPSPLEHTLSWTENRVGWGGDSYVIDYHGYSYSHLDALPHTGVQGQLYNGYSTETVTTDGAERLGIQVMNRGIFTRAVLIDLPRFRGVPFLEPGAAVTADELERWEESSGVTIEPGDVILIRTGRWTKRAQDGPWAAGRLLAGLHASAVTWIRERDPAAMGSDGVTDVLPSGVEGHTHPLHQLALVGMGMPLFDNLDLDALAEAAAARGRTTFLFTASPVRFTGGLGSPVNPTVIF